ncbi:MAG: bifunctional phosphopantothenoylcysteine decarboxylase/phosphopantothenate--cysteine ligase CoaBC [Saccharospirillaceae bacterium]|nr:bifunctional phosphopantothenoylcysteine decarboxylase/phosphopantothenate--cysteine ligase CoaBC [Pseudomonadales bacterium]NRB78511.1 bifunctional phosphopantothenoylcysteine decarboxylase/phosphopantothenate--cysteine ligase CoaBC [Saccharospirillaceae bacterium]
MNIILGITGGIAAYKTASLARLLVKQGYSVRVVMTAGACEFITPLTFQALTGNAVHTTLLDEQAEKGMGHIELAKWADKIIVAPASANSIASMCSGSANELLYAVILASKAKLFIAPAMNEVMWANPVVQKNIQELKKMYVDKIQFIGPDAGEQACGDVGYGRMSEPEYIVEFVSRLNEQITVEQILVGKKVMITAGPTQELIDPVRYITNKSSGKMGYALAIAAQKMGAQVILVSGPVNLKCPENIAIINVQSAKQMLQQALANINDCDIFIGCAAVADYACSQVSEHKLKKIDGQSTMTLELIKNPDILASIAQLPNKPFCVGFAAETQNVEQNAKIKLEQKNLDWIVANDVSKSEIGFNSDDNQVTLISKEKTLQFKKMSKQKLAYSILNAVCTDF